jgi:hypothetical protein
MKGHLKMTKTENIAKTTVASTPAVEVADATEKATTPAVEVADATEKATTKSVAKKTVKPVAKKIVKPAAKKIVKPAAKKIVKPAAKLITAVRTSSIFTLTAKAAHEDFGSGQRFAIAKLLKNGATRAQLIAKLPDISPANISWYLSMMVGAKLVKKTAQ